MRSWVLIFALLFGMGCATTPRLRPETSLKAARESSGPERLEGVLAQYRAIEKKGGWPSISSGPKLQIGDAGERVLSLRRRLAVTGDLKKDVKSEVFDGDLEQALRHFQERHGLEPDGAAGPATLEALNVPVEQRIRQLEINLERLRELEDKFEGRYVAVNIPDFRLQVVEKSRPLLTMNVVVGQRREWQTPLLDSQISYLILNPKWNVPPDIFRKEVLGHIQKDTDYLKKENMQVMGREGAVDPETVDWTQVDPRNPDYRIVQRSGPGNSLGRIKFMFPNRYAVYLHDTPAKKLFARPMRALSHGCVRVERPMDLAEFLMQDQEGWSRERIQSEINTGRERSVPLPDPVPLHIIYVTAWVDEEGVVQFRNDIYGRD